MGAVAGAVLAGVGIAVPGVLSRVVVLAGGMAGRSSIVAGAVAGGVVAGGSVALRAVQPASGTHRTRHSSPRTALLMRPLYAISQRATDYEVLRPPTPTRTQSRRTRRNLRLPSGPLLLSAQRLLPTAPDADDQPPMAGPLLELV